MDTEIKVTDLVAKLKEPNTIQVPSPQAASKKLERLLRFPDRLRDELARLLGDEMLVVITTQHHIIVEISSQRKRKQA